MRREEQETAPVYTIIYLKKNFVVFQCSSGQAFKRIDAYRRCSGNASWAAREVRRNVSERPLMVRLSADSREAPSVERSTEKDLENQDGKLDGTVDRCSLDEELEEEEAVETVVGSESKCANNDAFQENEMMT